MECEANVMNVRECGQCGECGQCDKCEGMCERGECEVNVVMR